MRPDPGVAVQESIVATMPEGARGRVRQQLAARGRLLAWQQADAAVPARGLRHAEFLLRRLYPTFPEVQLRQVLDQLAAAEAAGMWHGFKRPDPLPQDAR